MQGLQHLPVLIPILGAAGFVSGLSGFAFSGAAAAILFVLTPREALPLLLCLSIANQMLSISRLWHHMRILPIRADRTNASREVALPYLIGGLLGAPVGLELLYRVPTSVANTLCGAFLILFALVSLVLPALPSVAATGWVSAILTGWLGGVVGGFTAFPGAVPAVFLALRRLDKTETRGTLQPYILGMQLLSFTLLAVSRPSLFGGEFPLVFVACLPAVLAGSLIGVRSFHALGDHHFRSVVLVLLALSGSALLVRQLFLG